MKEYIVNITNDALSDMEEMYNYIAYKLDAPENALNQYKHIADAILSLSSLPERFGLFDSEPEKSLLIHKMIVDNYVVCYVVDQDVVTVTDVFYGASDIHRKLKERHPL
jgi:plasmid stabilization system protein ParE